MYMDTRKTKRVTQESTEMETFVPESSIKVFSSMESTKNWNAYHLFRFTWFVWIKKTFSIESIKCSGTLFIRLPMDQNKPAVLRGVGSKFMTKGLLRKIYRIHTSWTTVLVSKQLVCEVIKKTVNTSLRHKTFLKSASKPPQTRLSVLVS